MPVVAPSAGVPSGGKIEIEFTAGVWTDVTADVDKNPFTIKIGRTSEFSAPSTGALDGLRLDNHTGKYTPLSQVLADGTPHPYYPNVLPRKRIRYSNIPAGTRFVGYIKGWPPFVDQDGRAWVTITATDRLDQLARVVLSSPIAAEQSLDAPVAAYRLTEAAGSLLALDSSGRGNRAWRIDNLAGAPLAFGDAGPGFGDGTGLILAAGQYLTGDPSTWRTPWVAAPAFTVEIYLQTSGNTMGVWSFDNPFQGRLIVDASGYAWFSDSGDIYQGTSRVNDGSWHHVAATYTQTGGTATRRLYVDGAQQYVSTVYASNASAGTYLTSILLGRDTPAAGVTNTPFVGHLGYFAAYGVELPAARIAAHAAAKNGYSADTTDARIARWLTAAGLTPADWNLDVGKAVVGTYPQAGKDVVAASQDMATTEGAGSVFYVTGDGRVRFVNRTGRKPGPPVMTLDAEADLDGSVYSPSFDELTLVNQCTGNRAAASGTLSSQVFTDPVSVAKFGLTTDSGGVTSYALTDQDVLNLAQSRVAGHANPGFRLPQVGVDLVTATNSLSSLYAALSSITIGSRIRVTNLPIAQGPATQLDLIVEGWTETVGTEVYAIVFDTSPADNPALGVYDDTSYGRYQCSGQTLNAAITNSATSLVIATAGSAPTFTTVAGRYPLNIQIGQEIITLTSVPGGATSPQTFTAVTRAVAGTQAAAQAGGSTVNLFPAATYAL